MTQRTIMAGLQPNVTVHAGWNVVVKGWESDRVQVTAKGIFGLDLKRRGDDIQASIGLSGEVNVPLGSVVKVYSGLNANVSGLRGSVTVIAGGSAHITQVATLVHVSAGGAIDIDCDNLASDQVEFSSGLGLRFCVRQLNDATFTIRDIGGTWRAVMGDGRARIVLDAGGDVVLVTDREVLPQPPDGPLGCIERPEGATPQ